MSAVTFFSYSNSVHRILELGGGSGDLRYFFIKTRYKQDIQNFDHRPLNHPVIVLIDNDDGAKELFKVLRDNYPLDIKLTTSDAFFHIVENLYLVKTPAKGLNDISCIEDFFEQSLLATEINGKKFNRKKDIDTDSEYGKFVFAEKVVRPNAKSINFVGFAPLLERVAAVIDDYAVRKATAKCPSENILNPLNRL
jgi:hypothetical protein